jgi:putative membrane protein
MKQMGFLSWRTFMKFSTNPIVSVGAAALLCIGAGHVYAQNTSSTAKTATPSATSSSKASSAVNAADKAFLTKASMGGESEVELAALAQQKAADPKVKALAQRIETDHRKANDELRQIVTSKNVVVPGGLDKEHMALKAKLDKLDGVNFDQAYTAAMVQDHQKDISEFDKEARTATDQDVKGFAEKSLPTLREHLKMAQEAQKGVGMPNTSKRTTGSTGSTNSSNANPNGR